MQLLSCENCLAVMMHFHRYLALRNERISYRHHNYYGRIRDTSNHKYLHTNHDIVENILFVQVYLVLYAVKGRLFYQRNIGFRTLFLRLGASYISHPLYYCFNISQSPKTSFNTCSFFSPCSLIWTTASIGSSDLSASTYRSG